MHFGVKNSNSTKMDLRGLCWTAIYFQIFYPITYKFRLLDFFYPIKMQV